MKARGARVGRLLVRDTIFKVFLYGSSGLIAGLVLFVFLTLVVSSWPALVHSGFSFITSSKWNPVKDQFGVLPFLVGTLITSFLALLLSIPFSLAISLYLGEYSPDSKFSKVLQNMIELLAGVPSVIYGFWGLFVMAPVISTLAGKFGYPPYGTSVLTASLILTIMIIPYSASISREVINLVPAELKEAAYALGATRAEVIRYVILPYCFSGIFAGILLSLGRALGETMAVTMVIGNSNRIPQSLFDSANTMASVIANEFTEATGKIYTASLIEIGLILFLVTLLINLAGRFIINRYAVKA